MSEIVFVKELPWSGGRHGERKYEGLYQLLIQHPNEWAVVDEKTFRAFIQRSRGGSYPGVKTASRKGVKYASYSPERAAKELALRGPL